MNENTINNDLTMAGESKRALLARRYRIIRQLGQGGMGSVWLAEDTQLDGKLFAIKMLPSILVANKRAYNQLKAEALLAMKLIHPNIVQIRAFEENNNNPFLVMDYIDGETLDEWLGDRGQESGVRSQEAGGREVWLGRSPLCGAKSQEACERPREPYQESGVIEADIVRLLKPIAEALDYAHKEGVVHRDIKPANVMIRKDGRPFIMDFGIAREIQETMTRVTGKMSSGTLMYMSPEQLNGDVPKPSQDVYSFAAMVYECIKGEPPFCRGNIEFQIMNKDPEPLTYESSSVLASRPAIADSVMSGLAKKPEDRPKSCVAVLEGVYGKREKESGVRSQESGDREGERPREPQEVWPGPKTASRSEVARGLRASPRADETASIAAVNEDSNIRMTKGFSTTESLRSENLEIECLRRRVDAKIQKKAIDELPDFESEKNELNDILFKAELLLESKLWSDALSEFAVYVNKASDLLLRHKGIEEAKLAVAKVEALMPKHGDVKTVLLPGNVPLEMVYVASGSFDMGSPIQEIGRCNDELLHRVNLTRGFWLGKYPVTQRQWECVMGYNLSHFKGFDNPVEMVSWNDCQKFIAKCNQELQKEFGGEVRLPTEAEWEYACRAGSRGAYGGTGKLDDMGWYDNTFFGFGLKTKEVGLKTSNAWGFYDMHGNVWEWCQDWYGAYSTGEVTNPIGPASGDGRVLRGGGRYSNDRSCRSAYRGWYRPGYPCNDSGFRLACSVGPHE